MKPTLLFTFLFFTTNFCLAQNEKVLSGKIVCEGRGIANIDLVNLTSKKSTTTDPQGHFSIGVAVGDELYILSKEYIDFKLKITETHFNQNQLTITIEKKPIALEDVEIVNKSRLKVQISQADIDAIKLSKQSQALKVVNVYDGTIENGVDFVRMFKGIANWFKIKDKEKLEKAVLPPNFKDFLSSHYDRNFYLNTLKLKPEEIDLFIAYCEADVRAAALAERQDVLEMADFLFEKNEAFRKLER
ncbi:hypothetical protein [Flavobacterium sedimenticola]|uniref:Carboxypeptidase-like regulatory domain-containing protein n=1 Tax=Flavobacterium sedimenticola TaxID=3043286 RepID=A0ABT6XMY7_9FLAO|nr:hypothetical protein [Flavobacterium sedimenticola]MDI9256454.1 hypothetical protein [Flavobacterium sedimenticola]